jgi:hypothetical protein
MAALPVCQIACSESVCVMARFSFRVKLFSVAVAVAQHGLLSSRQELNWKCLRKKKKLITGNKVSREC